MQGISRSRHAHLVDALLQMERLIGKDSECSQQAAEYRVEMENRYREYEDLLNELAKQIAAYEQMYNRIKVQFVGKKLKELKKEIAAGEVDLPILVKNIRLAYST